MKADFGWPAAEHHLTNGLILKGFSRLFLNLNDMNKKPWQMNAYHARI